MNIRAFILVFVLQFFAFAQVASACPFCHSETGKQVNRSIFGSDFAANLVISVAPFAIIFLLIVLFHWGYLMPKEIEAIKKKEIYERQG